jgi:hypothetical protein
VEFPRQISVNAKNSNPLSMTDVTATIFERLWNQTFSTDGIAIQDFSSDWTRNKTLFICSQYVQSNNLCPSFCAIRNEFKLIVTLSTSARITRSYLINVESEFSKPLPKSHPVLASLKEEALQWIDTVVKPAKTICRG